MINSQTHHLPIRRLNPQLSPDIEAVLAHALINDVNQPYQSATEMKRDIDHILLRYVGLPGNSSSYRLGMPASIEGAPELTRASRSMQAQQQLLMAPVP